MSESMNMILRMLDPEEYTDILDMYDAEGDDDDIMGYKHNYRKRGLENTSSILGLYRCPKCGRFFPKELMDCDHIRPQSKGGSMGRYNLQMLCQHCNRSKHADTTDMDEDLARRYTELLKQNIDDMEFLKYASKCQSDE